jgi:hypothetical protein
VVDGVVGRQADRRGEPVILMGFPVKVRSQEGNSKTTSPPLYPLGNSDVRPNSPVAGVVVPNFNMYNWMYNEVLGKKKAIKNQWLISCLGGDEGIRTLDAGLCPHAPLAGECLRPLGHVS